MGDHRIHGIGGIQERPDALPRSLRLGTTMLRRRTLTGGTSVMVGPLPVTTIDGRPDRRAAGPRLPFAVRSRHRPARWPAHAVRRAGLQRGVPALDGTLCAIPAIPSVDTALVVQVLVDGRPLRALIDTGASGSLITASGMFRLGLTPGLLARDPVGNGARGRTGASADASPSLRRNARRPRHNARSDAMGGAGAYGADRRHAARHRLAAIAAGVAVVRDQADVRAPCGSGRRSSCRRR